MIKYQAGYQKGVHETRQNRDSEYQDVGKRSADKPGQVYNPLQGYYIRHDSPRGSDPYGERELDVY
jgi:hypothetical protein